MNMHFASAFLQQCFCCGWQDFILRASAFTSVTLAKTSTRSKLIRLLPLLNILPRIRSIMCTIVAQFLLYKCCYMQCNGLFSRVKNCVLKILLDALFEFKSKDQYERKMLNRLKRSFKRKIYIKSFCLMSQVFSLAPADEQMVKE